MTFLTAVFCTVALPGVNDAFWTVASVAEAAFAASAVSPAASAGSSSSDSVDSDASDSAPSCGGRTGALASTASASAADDLGSTRTSSAFSGAVEAPSTRSWTLCASATMNGSVPLPPSSVFSISRSVHAPQVPSVCVRTSNDTDASPS